MLVKLKNNHVSDFVEIICKGQETIHQLVTTQCAWLTHDDIAADYHPQNKIYPV